MQIDDFLQGLHEELRPIQDTAFRLAMGNNRVTDSAIALSHRPHVAPESYAMWLYKPLSDEALARYQRVHDVVLSEHYLPVLQKLNGAHIFEFSLYGVPPSMTTDTPLLDRTTTQPYDLGMANTDWKRDYAVPGDWFHFGSGPYSHEEHTGYFLDPAGTIYSVRKNGEHLRLWHSFGAFLTGELGRAETAYPAYEGFMAKLIAQSKRPQPWWRKVFAR